MLQGGAPLRLALAILFAAVVLPALVVRDATTASTALLASPVLVCLFARLELSLMLFAALAPLEDALATQVHPQTTKALGALVFASLAIRLLSRGTGGTSHPVHRCLVLFLVLLLAASVRQPNGMAGIEVLSRYLSFAGVYAAAVVVFQDVRWILRIFAAYVLGAALAAGLGLESFLSGAQARAQGPLNDPNDLAFILVVAIPLALALHAYSGHWRWSALAALCGVGAAATFSRGGALALAAVAVWGLLSRVVRPRVAVGGAMALGTGIGITAWVAADLVARSLQQKTYIAATNVDTRVLRWRAALEMMGDQPLLGLGPAGFRLNYDDYASAYDATAVRDGTVVHQMFLEVGAEAGIPAMLVFTAFVFVAMMAAGSARRNARDRTLRLLAAAIEAALVATVTASLFLTEQYYLPLWLLAAAAVAVQIQVDRTQPEVVGPFRSFRSARAPSAASRPPSRAGASA